MYLIDFLHQQLIANKILHQFKSALIKFSEITKCILLIIVKKISTKRYLINS